MSDNYSQSLKLLNFFVPIQQLQHRLPFVEQQNLNDVKPCHGIQFNRLVITCCLTLKRLYSTCITAAASV